MSQWVYITPEAVAEYTQKLIEALEKTLPEFRAYPGVPRASSTGSPLRQVVVRKLPSQPRVLPFISC